MKIIFVDRYGNKKPVAAKVGSMEEARKIIDEYLRAYNIINYYSHFYEIEEEYFTGVRMDIFEGRDEYFLIDKGEENG